MKPAHRTLDQPADEASRCARIRIRTRGRRHLGEFAPEVDGLIAASYPRLRDFLGGDPLLERCEFLSPSRAIVLRPTRAELVLLGYVDKASIAPGWDAAILDRIAAATGVPLAPLHALPADYERAIADVRGWRGREGVVARFLDADGTPRLVKIKAADYLRLHAYRSRLGGNRARRLAWLLDLRDIEQLLPALARYGLDWEAAEFARSDVAPYLAARRAGLVRWDALCATLEPWAGARAKADKRGFVEQVRAFLATSPAYPEDWWFTAAMRLFDAGAEDARLVIDAAVLGEAPASLRAWRKAVDDEVRAILTAPVFEDDG